MNTNETNTAEQNGEITLIALPLHIFQQNVNNGIIVDQNLLFKSLNDGSYVINTSQVFICHVFTDVV